MDENNNTQANKCVSVIMPCYNDGKYIEEAIASINLQTYNNIELIVINDSSDDDYTIKVIQKLRKNGVFVLDCDKGGPARARNIGISYAKGEYILPLDSDDIIEPTYIEKAAAILYSSDDIGCVYCEAEFFGERNGKWELPPFSIEQMLANNVVFATAMFRKSDWELVGGYDEGFIHGLEDYDFWISLIELGRAFYRIPQILFHYRIKKVSRSSKFDSNAGAVRKTQKLIFKKHSEIFLKYRPHHARNNTLRSILRPLLRIYRRLPIPKVIRIKLRNMAHKLYHFIKRISSKNKNYSYNQWIAENEPTRSVLRAQKKYKFAYNPKISLVMPMYNTDIEFFKVLIQSLIAQTYKNWELCAADGSSVKNDTIEKICQTDSRIKYNFIGENKGVSGNTNEAIKMVTGDYIGFIDHDDVLPPFSIFEVATCINETPEVEFIYSDEDRIKESTRFAPNFKNDFAPDTLRSGNFVCHLFVLKKDLLEKLGDLRSQYDGSQDFDLALRASEMTSKIVHIRKILYHWRMHSKSFSQTSNAPFDAGTHAIKDHIERIGANGDVEYEGGGIYRVIYDIKGNPSISILIPNKDQIDLLKQCVETILQITTYSNYELVIIENNSENLSTFEYYTELEMNPRIRILRYAEKGFNYSKLINFGVNNCNSDYVVQLNNDTKMLTPNWLELMLGFAQRQDVGAVGAAQYLVDSWLRQAGHRFTPTEVTAHIYSWDQSNKINRLEYWDRIQNYSAISGACVMSRRALYEKVGFMDTNLAQEYNDIDFCMKLRALGLLVVYNPLVEFIHYESKSRGRPNTPEKRERYDRETSYFMNKWKKELNAGDPYFNIDRERVT